MRLRFDRFGSHWAVSVTRWFYFTNHSYPGERSWYVRLGRYPGWTRACGPVRREDAL